MSVSYTHLDVYKRQVQRGAYKITLLYLTAWRYNVWNIHTLEVTNIFVYSILITNYPTVHQIKTSFYILKTYYYKHFNESLVSRKNVSQKGIRKELGKEIPEAISHRLGNTTNDS